MADPYVLGQAIGFSMPIAGVTWFAVRTMLGSAGSREVARLQAIAAGQTPPSAATSSLRTLAPIAAAAFTGLLAFGFMFVKGSNGFGALAAQGMNASALPKLKDGFVNGCTRTCSQAGSPKPWCATMCECVLTDIRTRQGGDEGLLEWFKKSASDQELVKRDAGIASEACAQTLPPPN